ncbi:MAG TPA: hypothetical protein VLW75_07430 [Rhizomicrobium sp.]|nr:hypothetical protein [Rhizomicrobium sp.]
MSKLGVGVGEDFPVDDGGGSGDDRAEFEAWKRRRDEWRAKREQWRHEREEWQQRRDEWRARRRAFKQKVRDAARDTFGPEYEAYRDARWRYRAYWPFGYGVLRILGIVLVIALISEIFRAPLLFLALAAGAWFFIFHRHHRHAYSGCDYDIDAQPAARPQAQPSQPSQPPPPQEAS